MECSLAVLYLTQKLFALVWRADSKHKPKVWQTKKWHYFVFDFLSHAISLCIFSNCSSPHSYECNVYLLRPSADCLYLHRTHKSYIPKVDSNVFWSWLFFHSFIHVNGYMSILQYTHSVTLYPSVFLELNPFLLNSAKHNCADFRINLLNCSEI